DERRLDFGTEQRRAMVTRGRVHERRRNEAIGLERRPVVTKRGFVFGAAFDVLENEMGEAAARDVTQMAYVERARDAFLAERTASPGHWSFSSPFSKDARLAGMMRAMNALTRFPTQTLRPVAVLIAVTLAACATASPDRAPEHFLHDAHASPDVFA